MLTKVEKAKKNWRRDWNEVNPIDFFVQDRKAKSHKIRLLKKRGVLPFTQDRLQCAPPLFTTCYKFDLIRTTVIFMAIGGKHERQQEAQIIE